MSDLRASVVPVTALQPDQRAVMLGLMHHVYQGVDPAAFQRDLAAKDECILLHTADEQLVGFSTQRLLRVPVAGREVEGLFSGDVVIHPDHWGSPALFQAFVRRYVVADHERWWFLVSKGQRTYRLMPLFFREFWPDRRRPTPPQAQELMHAYARQLFPDDYDATTGVLAYRRPKDRLRPDYLGRDEQRRGQADAAFFEQVNPGHRQGHDLVCLTRLHPDNLRPRIGERLLGP